jgi:ankyrin repeat protein
MIDVLLAHGAHINGKDLHGWTVLDTACSSELAKSAEMAEFLISRGADVNAEDYDGFTVLDLCRDKRVARVLRKHGGHSGHK